MWRYVCSFPAFVWQFPSHSYWFSHRSLTLLCTRIWVCLYGIKEVGGLEGLGFVEKIRNFKAIHDCRFHHLLAHFLAFESSQELFWFYWHFIFISFLSFAAFWKMLITILFKSKLRYQCFLWMNLLNLVHLKMDLRFRSFVFRMKAFIEG